MCTRECILWGFRGLVSSGPYKAADRALKTYLKAPSGYRDLLMAMLAKRLEAPRVCWPTEVTSAWGFLESPLLVRADKAFNRTQEKLGRKFARDSIRAAQAKAGAAPPLPSDSGSSSDEDSPFEGAGV